METVIDKFGRVVIPKRLREDLDLKPGSALQVEELNGGILLRPVQEEPQVRVKNGVLVFSGLAGGKGRDYRPVILLRCLPLGWGAVFHQVQVGFGLLAQRPGHFVVDVLEQSS